MSINPDKIIEQYKQMSANGGVGTIEPLLSLFSFEGKPLSLTGREPMLPVFKTNRPKRMTLQAGRQVSKTMSIGELGICTAGFAGLQAGIIEPRFIQKKAINDQILTPLLRECYVQDKLIRKNDIDTLDVKRFLSGGQLRLVNGFKSADGARGISGLSLVMLDECTLYNTPIMVITDINHPEKYKIKKICEICEGDVLKSFTNGSILYSVAARDASYRGRRPCYQVTTRSGRVVVCTSNHYLPTNLGKLRLEEIIDYVADFSRVPGGLEDGGRINVHCGDRELQRNAAKCSDGLTDGGRVPVCTFVVGEGVNPVESELQTARVQFTSVPSIIRARNKRTYEETESRLRRLLVGISADQFRHVGVAVCHDSQDSGVPEDYNPHIPCGDNSPDSAGLVVHGRRVEKLGAEQRTDCDQRLQFRRGILDSGLVENPMGSGGTGKPSNSQLNQENSPCDLCSCENLSEIFGDGVSLFSGLDEVQNKHSYRRLCDVWDSYTKIDSPLLFCDVRSGISKTSQTGVLREEQEQASAVFERVEESPSGISTGSCQEIPGEHVRGAERSTSETSRGVFGTESGSCECTEKSSSSSYAERSDIQKAEIFMGCQLSYEVEAGSGKVGSLPEKKKGIRNRVSEESRSSRQSYGASEITESSGGCGPREESGPAGARSQSQESSRGTYDRGGKICQEAAGSRQKRSIQGKEESGTGERSSEASRAESCNQGIYVGEIQKQNSGGTGEDQCPTKRASSTESCCGGAHSEVPRTVYDEVRSGHSSDNESGGTLLTSEPAEYFYDPIVNIEYVGEHPVYDIEVVGTHNYILANGICSYNCQDLLNKNVPVFEAAADAKTESGFRLYSGTAKTLDGTLAIKFEQSSQGHWCVKCECGKYIIFAPEEQLFSTISPKGCLCPFCSRKIHSETGGFIFKFPSRCATHVGYHFPQTIFPFHHTELAWKEIIYKQNNIPKTQFFNEVLGISDSDSVRLLTKADLLNARNNIHTKEDAKSILYQYDMRVLGVDWGGGGGKESATGICVIGKNYAVNHFETLYINRLPTGMTPEQEASFVDRIASEFEVDFIAHDYTGAGFMREAFFLNVFPQWKDRVFPVSYSYKPTSDLVTVSGTGSRTSYVVDKTKSLLLTIGCIKHAVLTVPWFDPLDPKAPQLDFLAIIEHEQKTSDESATGNEVLRGSSVYLLDKVSGVRDDAAQATNIAFIAMCHTLGVYPVIHYDSKFDISEEQYRMLAGD